MGICATAEAKRAVPPSAGPEDEEVEREDELPTVVVLRKGDLGEQDFLEHRQKMKDEGRDLEHLEMKGCVEIGLCCPQMGKGKPALSVGLKKMSTFTDSIIV